MIAIIHNVRSLYNVGSILRTSDGVGLEKLYLAGITPSPLDRAGVLRSHIEKTALGAEKTVTYENVKSTGGLINKLKKQGYTILAIEENKNAEDIYKYKMRSKKVVLVFGSEVKGLPSTILKKCDKVIKIPMLGRKKSLNVSIAFGIATYELSFRK
ncbi:MAG: RNA methyltransferase [Candidatus Harrisonbacteria bacterium CG10_big_fil_rev_8_21_14_0_10_38_8]|uniref:RNA methyltransferase n=1 Tax=Candidatus Harrisonbacteria bacterium CG10_big_fil_rev_8_21_14_0_10_38_8 TaxID=1974582 RepID=A0A2M6WJL4_9BACT|nr:MAG: RNA methyltransferase [Candidatus Harrisonbacteria bacterium CG10_big_fil_rev_8_21_14_0_10_38_8]